MNPRRALLWAGVAVVSAWVLVPIWLIAGSSVGGQDLIDTWPKPFWPAHASLAQLTDFLAIEGVWHALLISVEVAVMCMLFSILLGAPAGYALARFRFRGATLFRLMVLLTRAFPVAILALPFAVLVSASLFQAIPHELEEAAWVFGCSRLSAALRVVLPLALPGIVATAIFAFVISWNEVFAASVLTVRNRTLTAYLLAVLSESPLYMQFTGGFLLIVPSVLFIFLVRKQLFAMWGIANR